MPINCPINRVGASCEDCRYLSLDNDKCHWFFPSMPLSELLTPEERIDILEEKLTTVQAIVPSWVLAEIRKDLNDTRNRLTYLENKINEHLNKPKRKPRARPGGGITEV